MSNPFFNCVDFKNKAQEELYNELHPANNDEYIEKLKLSIENSAWINKILKNNLQEKNL